MLVEWDKTPTNKQTNKQTVIYIIEIYLISLYVVFYLFYLSFKTYLNELWKTKPDLRNSVGSANNVNFLGFSELMRVLGNI